MSVPLRSHDVPRDRAGHDARDEHEPERASDPDSVYAVAPPSSDATMTG
jgi:hypothetical protein